MKKWASEILTFIIALLVAVLFFSLISCSPQKRLNRILKKHPELIKNTSDTTDRDKLIPLIPLPLTQDTTRFDSLLNLYIALYLRSNLNTEGDTTQENTSDLKKELRKGAFTKTSGTYKDTVAGVSFNYTFDPALNNPLSLQNLKIRERIITNKETIPVTSTTWEDLKKYWFVFLLIALLVVIIILKK